jgi:hypothetical protein
MPKVDELLTDIAQGSLQLPEFQRGYVWTRDQVRTFVQSLYRGHPTGHLLLWHAYGPVKVRGGEAEQHGSTLLLLDGQQRLTTLYAVINGEPPPFYEGETLFFDLHFNLVDESFSYYNKSLMEGNPTWISVHEFLRRGLNDYLDSLSELPPEEQEVAHKSLSRLNKLDRVHSYIYQVDELKDPNLTIDQVVEIFNRVNSKGTPLSRADLAMAHICSFWPEARGEFRHFIADMTKHGFGVEASYLVRATSAVAGGSVNFDAGFYQVSSKAFQDAWPKVRASFEYLVNVLKHDAYIDSISDLSTPLVIVPTLVFLGKHNATFATANERDSFLRWMYLANIWGRYAGQTDTKLNRDIASLGSPDPAGKLIEAIVADRGRIHIEAADLENKGTTSGLYKFSLVLARSRSAKDWFTGQTLYQKAIGKSNGLHSHHIFPRAVLTKLGITERAVVNQIANRAFLTQKANLKIASRVPSKYLPAVEAKFPGALRQQLVPMTEELWHTDGFDAFLERRRKLLARAMNAYLDKLGLDGVGGDDGVGIEALLEAPESQQLEFKSSLRWDYQLGYTNRKLEDVAVKAVAAFLNTDGGDLIVGVDDKQGVLGLANDYESSKSIGGRDGFERHIRAVLRKAVGDATLSFVSVTFHSVDGEDICQVSVDPSDHPVYVPGEDGQAFYVRQGNASQPLDPKGTLEYASQRWKEY